MSAITVRTMLSMILENNLQMDDVIRFGLSEETNEVLGTFYDIDCVRTETYTIKGTPEKTLLLSFDLNDVADGVE